MEETAKEETIKLDQFMKLAQTTLSGGQAKQLIQGGYVIVNGEIETRRGRKLRDGDVVVLDDEEYIVGIEPEETD